MKGMLVSVEVFPALCRLLQVDQPSFRRRETVLLVMFLHLPAGREEIHFGLRE